MVPIVLDDFTRICNIDNCYPRNLICFHFFKIFLLYWIYIIWYNAGIKPKLLGGVRTET